MAVDHYENFPVASLLLPRRLRAPVVAIYRFARSADDIADEGHDSTAHRLHQLAAYRSALAQMSGGCSNLNHQHPLFPIFEPLAQAVEQFNLPLQPLYDLLSAFEQDTRTSHWQNDAALLDYCKRSANPVGRLLLHLFDASTTENIAASDAVCTGLQLTNFWQDIAIDLDKSRIYLPLDKMAHYNIRPEQARTQPANTAWQQLMREQVEQARSFLLTGQGLPSRLGGRFGLEVGLTIQGGLRILECIEKAEFNVFAHRPTIKTYDWPLLFWRTLRQWPQTPLFTGSDTA